MRTISRTLPTTGRTKVTRRTTIPPDEEEEEEEEEEDDEDEDDEDEEDVSVEELSSWSQPRSGLRFKPLSTEPDYQEKYYKQILDHFSFLEHGSRTFFQRYLITDEYWIKFQGAIFFYTGNEVDIWECAKNSGFIAELAATVSKIITWRITPHKSLDKVLNRTKHVSAEVLDCTIPNWNELYHFGWTHS
ncbi:hypothetical protein NDU88_011998 [Pleurodeles waltl]|uniref:Uncharacterized protein n=1 Tax=Pleurodeles waltl TaxID=8319 RepID=A0AAV7R4P8_PLEWA|nr:hypothetical protein NDU88_011998 [Pleurodeles waltl]